MKIIREQAKGQSAADLLDLLKNPKPLLTRVGQMMVDATVGRIVAVKEDPQGNPWAPWAPSTARARERAGTASRGLLYNTGALASSIYFTINDKSVSVSSSAPYAEYLQNGTPKMPARPFLGIGEGEQDAIHTYMQNAFRGRKP